MSHRIPVGILGATGMVGQTFIQFLQGHPWFEITWLGASDRSAGKPYAEATSWRLDGSIPENVRALRVSECKPSPDAPRLMFSSMDASVATEIELEFAKAGHFVVSNSRNFRMEADVPLLVPEVNADHLGVLDQQAQRGWKGRILTNPNCSTVALTMALGPLKQFGIERVICTTLQAVSGAGYPGVASMDILGNVIPYIGSEEEKMQQETQKILGAFTAGVLVPLDAKVSAHCNRVPSVNGHLVTVSVELAAKPGAIDLRAAIDAFGGEPQRLKLPSAPARPVLYLDEPDRPQPRRDAERDRGMTATMGRLRPCLVLDWKFVSMAHNTIRGAAGAAVLNAELLVETGRLQ